MVRSRASGGDPVLFGPALIWPALILGLLSCAEPHSRPNLVVITLDTTRADHVGTYGYYRPTTPSLDALAAESIVFEQMVVPMATTLPSHTTLFTGTHPLEHGVTANLTHGGQQLHASESLQTFPTVLQADGYQTAGFISATPLKKGSGIEAGFDSWSEPKSPQRTASVTLAAATRWLTPDRGKDAPFLVWVHLFEPHGPFTAHTVALRKFPDDQPLKDWLDERGFEAESVRPTGQTVLTAESTNKYDSEIRVMDRHLGKFLDHARQSPWWNNTVVVVVGDHGEGLGQHGMAGHGGTWREQLHAPWMIRTPWDEPQRVSSLVTMSDVLPTLFGLAEFSGEAELLQQMSGRDALSAPPVAQFEQSSDRQKTFGRVEHALSVGRWRWRNPGNEEAQLHELGADPHEQRDLSKTHPIHAILMASWAAEMYQKLEQQGQALGRAERTELSADQVEQLRALGYVEDDIEGE